MAKTINSYRNFTPQDIIDKASLPYKSSYMSISGDDVLCSFIEMNRIKTRLVEDNWSLTDLSTSSNVNVWSGYGPTTRSVVGGVLTNSVAVTPHEMGEFMGYNHNAVTPHYNSGGTPDYVLKQSGQSETFSCVLDIGEVRYDLVPTYPATYVHFSLWINEGTEWVTGAQKVIAINNAIDEAGGYIGSSIIDFSQADTRIDITNITTTTTYTYKIWFCNNANFEPDGRYRMFVMTEFPEWTRQVRITSANHFFINGPENNSYAYGDTFTSGKWTVNGCVLDLENGTLDQMYYLKLNELLSGSYNRLYLTFRVEQGYLTDENGINDEWIGTQVSDETADAYIIYHPYDGNVWNDNIGRTVEILTPFDIWSPLTPMDDSGYGYRIFIECDTRTE